MSETAVTPDPVAAAERRSTIIEVITAILLGLATIGAAYAAYQASLYDGNSLENYSIGISKTAEGSGKDAQAMQVLMTDMNLWMEWQSRMISADKNDGAQAKIDKEIADTIENNFMSAELQEAIIWSVEESEKQKKHIDYTDNEAYALSIFSDSLDFEDKAAAAFATAGKQNGIGDKYMFVTVLFAIVLFFAGIALVFKREGVKLTIILIAAGLFVFSLVRLLGLPPAS